MSGMARTLTAAHCMWALLVCQVALTRVCPGLTLEQLTEPRPAAQTLSEHSGATTCLPQSSPPAQRARVRSRCRLQGQAVKKTANT